MEGKETLGSALDSWAGLMGNCDKLVVWEKRGLALGFFRAEWLLGVVHTWYRGAEFSLCAIKALL